MRWFERHRQEWIGDRIAAVGYINRSDVMEKFEVSIPTASRDLRVFQENHPGILHYNLTLKRYEMKLFDCEHDIVSPQLGDSEDGTCICGHRTTDHKGPNNAVRLP